MPYIGLGHSSGILTPLKIYYNASKEQISFFAADEVFHIQLG